MLQSLSNKANAQPFVPGARNYFKISMRTRSSIKRDTMYTSVRRRAHPWIYGGITQGVPFIRRKRFARRQSVRGHTQSRILRSEKKLPLGVENTRPRADSRSQMCQFVSGPSIGFSRVRGNTWPLETAKRAERRMRTLGCASYEALVCVRLCCISSRWMEATTLSYFLASVPYVL